MDFGVIIVCSEKDFSLAKGCLASVRYFMPGVEVCLLIDGNPNIDTVKEIYHCHIIQKKDVKNEFLKENSFGWGITKMIAFWESPFDKFLLLDADTCLWGDISADLKWENNDMIIDLPQYNYDHKAINTWFFNTEKLRQIDRKFESDNFSDRYFCTGIMFSKRNIFPIEWYEQLLSRAIQDPTLFINSGEMGLLNYMIFKSVSDSSVKVRSQALQYICADHTKKHSKQLFGFRNGTPLVKSKLVIHYVGDWKPYRKNKLSYHDPMTYFRKVFYESTNPELSKQQINKIMDKEDIVFEKKKTPREKLKDIVRPFAKPIYIQLKRLFN